MVAQYNVSQYDKVLIPLDGSPVAEEILAHLAFLGAPEEIELELLNVVVPAQYAVTAPQMGMIDVIGYLVEGAGQYVNRQKAALQAKGYSVTSHVLKGDAALTIVNLAQTDGAKLIAMTTHGRTGLSRWALGSVTERVIQQSTLPLLLVRPETAPITQLRQLLVPLDGSELAEDALTQAVMLAKMSGASILLVQITHELDEGNRRILFPREEEADEALAQWLQDAETYLQSVKHELLEQGLAVETLVKAGDPATEICRVVASRAIDLVVMSTHGRSGMRRWMYGSVANKVLRGLAHPLLLIPSRAVTDDA